MNTLAPLPPSVTTMRIRRWGPRLAWAWDRASIYLPVLLMGGLALGSYWVVRQTPAAPEPPAQRPVSSEPDYTMRDFALRTFGVDGHLRAELQGREIRHYPHTDTTVVDEARVRQFGPNGRLSTAHARELWTNGEQTEYRLRGNVRFIQTEGATPNPADKIEFQGQSLTFLAGDKRLVSQEPVTFWRGPDRISAQRMEYDQSTGQLQLQGQVRATLTASP